MTFAHANVAANAGNDSHPEPVDPIALSTLQPTLENFRTSDGYVPYTRCRDVDLTLGAPVCRQDKMAELASEFLETFPRATFFYVTKQQMQWMKVPGRVAWAAGADVVLPLPYATQWPKEVLGAKKKAERAGLRVREVFADELVGLERAMKEAQRLYLQRREVNSEMRFLTRPCLFSQERRGRTFALEVGGTFLGFVVLDPYITQHQGKGYLLNLFRIGPTKLWGVYLACVLGAMRKTQ